MQNSQNNVQNALNFEKTGQNTELSKDFIQKEMNTQKTELSNFTKQELIEKVANSIGNFANGKERITPEELEKYFDELDMQGEPNAELEEYYREDKVATEFDPYESVLNIYKNTAKNALKELGYEYDGKQKMYVKQPNTVQNVSEVAEKVKDLIYNNDDVYDSDIDKIVNDITGEEFKDADFDNDEVYDKYAERMQQLYEEVQSELENQGYIRNKNSYDYKDASYIPSSERLEQAKNDLNITYGERPNNTLQVKQMLQIRENIDDIISDIKTPESISISKTESKSSADATYIDVYNEATDESKTIRVANHYKEGVSGKADYNIYISDYNTMEELNKAIEDTISKAQKATENSQTLQSKKITPSNDVDIMVESDYNEYKATRKREPNNYVYKKITDKDRARVSSDYMLNKSKYEDDIGVVNFDNASYVYEIIGDDINILSKFRGSQKFINGVIEDVKNSFKTEPQKLNTIIKNLRSNTRKNNIANATSGKRGSIGESSTNDIGSSGQQSKTNIRESNKNNVQSIQRNLKNSEQSSFSLPKTDNQGRTLTKEQQEYFKDSKVRDENGNLLTVYHGTEANVGIPKEHWFSIFDIDKSNSNSSVGAGFYFTDNFERAKSYAHTKGNVYSVYLNIVNPFKMKKGKTFDETVEEINPNYDNSSLYLKDSKRFDGYKLRNYLIENGYDGISLSGTYVAFYPEQIKNVDNTTPTTNSDIRYSQSDKSWSKYLKEYWDLMPNSTKTFGLPTAEELQNFDKTGQNVPTGETLQPSIENITGNGYNQVGGVEDVGQNGYGLTKVVERERQNIGTAEKILKKEPQITEKELTQQQIKTKNIAKKKYNTNIVYYDGKKVDIKGLATGKNEIYIDSETATIYGSDFVLGHEIAEDMLSNHTDVVINDYDKMVEKIKSSKGFTNLFQDYTEGMSSKQKQQLALNLDKVAKEILCDINAGKNGTSTELAKIVTNTIKNNLEPQLYNDIIGMFNKYENQIYGKENSTQGSFLLPTSLEELQRFDNEQSKKAYESLHMKNESELANQMELNGLEYGKDIPTEEMLETAKESADYATFKNENKVSRFLGNTRNLLNNGKAIGVADALGLTFTFVDAIGRVITGTGLGALVHMMMIKMLQI